MQRVRLAYYASHPIQYQAPLLRRLAQEPGIELMVFFGSDFSVRGYTDRRFGVEVKWDVSLVDGYRHEFLPVIRDDARTGVTWPLNYGLFSRLRRGLEGEPFDVLWVHGYSTVNAAQALVAAKALGVPVMLRAESWSRSAGWTKRFAKRMFFAALGEMVDAVLPIGTRNAAFWNEYLPAVRQFPVPYAVDNAYFRKRSEDAAGRQGELRAELGLEPGRPVILFAAKLQRRKGCGDLLEAYRSLVAEGLEAVPYLVIVGDGAERKPLERGAEGMEGVRFCGFRNQSEMPRFFDLAKVFVLPSRREPWGLIVNEVMNAGRPVIVSDEVGCQPDLVRNGVEGYVYPTGDVAALRQALYRVLASPGVAERMGSAALERIGGWGLEEDVAGLLLALGGLTGRLG